MEEAQASFSDGGAQDCLWVMTRQGETSGDREPIMQVRGQCAFACVGERVRAEAVDVDASRSQIDPENV